MKSTATVLTSLANGLIYLYECLVYTLIFVFGFSIYSGPRTKNLGYGSAHRDIRLWYAITNKILSYVSLLECSGKRKEIDSVIISFKLPTYLAVAGYSVWKKVQSDIANRVIASFMQDIDYYEDLADTEELNHLYIRKAIDKEVLMDNAYNRHVYIDFERMVLILIGVVGGILSMGLVGRTAGIVMCIAWLLAAIYKGIDLRNKMIKFVNGVNNTQKEIDDEIELSLPGLRNKIDRKQLVSMVAGMEAAHTIPKRVAL